jgi:hypothetical protein
LAGGTGATVAIPHLPLAALLHRKLMRQAGKPQRFDTSFDISGALLTQSVAFREPG